MNVWLAEKHEWGGGTEKLGVFSDPSLAQAACQGVANQYFGEKNTPALSWLGDDGYRSATYSDPSPEVMFFHVTRFIVDEVVDRY